MEEQETGRGLHYKRLPANVEMDRQSHEEKSFSLEEIKIECSSRFIGNVVTMDVFSFIRTKLFVPYIPAFHRPGWMISYMTGPHSADVVESIINDIWAGIIVALTLIPQGLSYAQLANVPSIHGLYSAIMPSVAYVFLGSSFQLALGPVAIVSLLTGQLVSKYVPNYAKDTSKAIDLGQQVALVCAVYLVLLSITRAGSFIRFISHPVMSGFTSAAAMLIGLSQLKNAFGFPSSAPQTGQVGYDYNYQVMHWYVKNWSNVNETNGVKYINPYSTKITLGVFIPLMLISIIKRFLEMKIEKKKSFWFRLFTYVTNTMPLFAILISALVTKYIIENAVEDIYARNIKVIGVLPSGLDIIHIPSFRAPWGALFADTLPLTLISFMESYSVARKIATMRNELHILNANQELFAIGIGNLLGSVSSSFPVSGSFSRSSLNAASGARTPLAKATTTAIICIALQFLTTQLYYIPNAALAAIIWVAISNLVSFPDMWEAWKHSNNDFIVMFITFTGTLFWNTEVGLLIGIGSSFIALILDTYAFPIFIKCFNPIDERSVILEHYDNLITLNEVVFIRVLNNINFITGVMMKDYIVNDVIDKKAEEIIGIVVDFSNVHVVDLTGLLILKELVEYTHSRGLLFGAVNVSVSVDSSMKKFGIVPDSIGDMRQATRTSDGNSRDSSTESSVGPVIASETASRRSDVSSDVTTATATANSASLQRRRNYETDKNNNTTKHSPWP